MIFFIDKSINTILHITIVFITFLISKNRRRFENFAQLVRDEAYAVGCAMAHFKIDKEYITLFTCNYSAGIAKRRPIYKTDKKGASGCKKGTNKDFKGLCSVKEIYNNPDYYKRN